MNKNETINIIGIIGVVALAGVVSFFIWYKEVPSPAPIPSPLPVSVKFGSPVTFVVSEQVKFSDGLAVTLLGINDSRCPPKVVCVWEGELSLLFRITGGNAGKSLKEIHLGTATTNSVTENGYTFTLNEATVSTATVVVTKGKGGLSLVTLYAYEKDGSHIFDGAVIAAIDASSGKVVAEQLADGDGKVVFSVPEGSYRFQPSPLRENRVVGFLTLFIPLNENKPQTLLLTEVGPSSFGAPVDTCEEKYDAIESIFDAANYCTEDADCKAIPLGGAYVDFGCWKHMHRGYNTSILYQRMDEYVNACTQKIDKCASSPLVVCRVGRCVQAQQ